MEEIAKRNPVDRTAARVTSQGPKWVESSAKNDRYFSPVPHPTRPLAWNQQNLAGRTIGTLTVIGLAAWKAANAKATASQRTRWVCRCLCGWYVIRSTKAIKNPNNAEDACDRCRHLAQLKYQQSRIESGEYTPKRPWLPHPND